jgi:hydroxypyruvate isomerase
MQEKRRWGLIFLQLISSLFIDNLHREFLFLCKRYCLLPLSHDVIVDLLNIKYGGKVMKVSICVDAVYMDKDFVESLKEISSIGVKAFEFWSWWDKDLKVIKDAKDELGLEVAAFCTKFVSLVDKSKREEYISGLKESIEAAKFMGCKTLISQVGNNTNAPRQVQRQNIIDGLKECVPLLKEAGITLVLEPLNIYVDHANYYLYSSREGFDIVKAVGSRNVKLLFDLYHQQIMEGNLIINSTNNIDKIAHFHAAGNPGRHELSFGEVNYKEVFKAIDAVGYEGFVGFEYFPVEEPAKGIKAFLYEKDI